MNKKRSLKKIMLFHLREIDSLIKFAMFDPEIKKRESYLSDIRKEVANIYFKINIMEDFRIKDVDLAVFWNGERKK